MNAPYAKYTMTYQEVVSLDATIPEVLSFGDDTKDKAIRDMVMDVFWNWEIAGETIGEFRNMLMHTFNSYRDYYNELIDAYQTKIDMLDGRKTSTTIQGNDTTVDKGSSTYDTAMENNRKGSNTDTNYDLPRSNVSENRPSSKSTRDIDDANTSQGSGGSEYSKNKDFTRNRTVTVTGGENVIQLKKQYLTIIRNIYRECALNLQKCFLEIFW